jgi:hypothetical protein
VPLEKCGRIRALGEVWENSCPWRSVGEFVPLEKQREFGRDTLGENCISDKPSLLARRMINVMMHHTCAWGMYEPANRRLFVSLAVAEIHT